MRPRVVLDTNVVLDLLLFADPACAALHGKLSCGHLDWIATPSMRAELVRIARPELCARWRARPEQVIATFDRRCRLVLEPERSGAASNRCTDPTDQVFIDLALAAHARWLLSRDHAILKVGRRLGRTASMPRICTPQAWQP